MPVTLLQRLTGSYAVIYLRGNKVAVFWIGVLAAIWAIAALAPVVATHDPLRQSADLLEGPSARHWMGTDEFGRDLFSRIVYGGRISLSVGIIAVTIAVLAGSTLGLIAGYLGGLVDTILMRFIDGLMAFPKHHSRHSDHGSAWPEPGQCHDCGRDQRWSRGMHAPCGVRPYP